MPAIPAHHTAIDEGAWDGAGEAAKANGAAELAHMHAWWDGDHPDLEQSYNFAHHAAGTGTPANLRAIGKARARLANSDIPAGDRSRVEAHLNAHQSDARRGGATGGSTLARPAPAGQPDLSRPPGEARAEAYEGDRRAKQVVAARLQPFGGYFTRQSVLVNGKAMEQLDGYASVTGVEYEMYDFFGVFYEKIAPAAFDSTLARNPDVAFLLNHRGMTMARTTTGTLSLDADPRGLHMQAYVNADRTDVRDLLIAIDDKNITEMSFAFMLLDGEWDEEFMHFEITEVDIDRGDVSAVNYGANPFTSIEARAAQVLMDVEHLPRAAAFAAYQRLSAQFGELRVEAATPAALRAARALEEESGVPQAVVSQRGLSTQFVSQMLALDE